MTILRERETYLPDSVTITAITGQTEASSCSSAPRLMLSCRSV